LSPLSLLATMASPGAAPKGSPLPHVAPHIAPHQQSLLDHLPAVWPPAVALLLPLLLGLVIMPWGIGRLSASGLAQRIRAEGPQSHLAKGGTPTAGGLLVIGLVLVTVLFIDRSPKLWPVLAALALGAALGMFDDIVTVTSSSRGLRARHKIVLQLGIGLVIGFWMWRLGLDRQLVPFLGAWKMGFLLVPVAAVALVAAANAFNLTDGSDGLAPGVTLLVVLVMAVMLRNLSHQVALTRLMVATAGALLAFLVYNLPPARVFLGGVGSEGLGMMVAATAIAGGFIWYLPLLAAVPAIEALSVIIQVYSYRSRRKRVFRMAPLHHHFQLNGWNEWAVALAGWAATSIAGSLTLLIVRRAA
jgi:phospho-N-acetylmuramoyl-pentapeptide-transferase